MEKTINVDGKECKFKSTAAIPRMYRMKFGRDIFVDLGKLEKKIKNKDEPFAIDSLEIFEDIAYIMHKHGDPSQPDNIDTWLDQFETFDIYKVLPEIISLWKINNDGMSTAKKNAGA